MYAPQMGYTILLTVLSIAAKRGEFHFSIVTTTDLDHLVPETRTTCSPQRSRPFVVDWPVIGVSGYRERTFLQYSSCGGFPCKLFN